MAPARKKAKTAHAKNSQAGTGGTAGRRTGGSKKGSLQLLPDLAVEIQLEIFGYLHPQDLLSMCRTCKKFRSFFLQRNNEPLWRKAVESTPDLPGCPPDLSLPAYVHLLYSIYCQDCASPHGRMVCWAWFKRYCVKCLPNHSYTWPQAEQEMRRTLSWMPCFEPMYYHTFVEKHKDKPLSTREKDIRVRKSDILEAFRKYRTHHAAFDTYSSECVKSVRERQQWVRRCHKWLKRQEEIHEAELEQARASRFAEIVARLRSSEWKEEMDFLGDDGLEEMSKITGVRQSSKLTDRVWEQVLEALDSFLNETRRSRLKAERAQVLQERFRMLDEAILAHYVQIPRTADMDCRPHFIDFALMEECRAIIDVPASVTVSPEEFAALIPSLGGKWMALRQRELRLFLTDVLRSQGVLDYSTDVEGEVDVLDLAVAIFGCPGQCHRPSSPLRPTDLLNHVCTRRLRRSDAESKYWYDTYAFTAATFKADPAIAKTERFFDANWDGTQRPFVFSPQERAEAGSRIKHMCRIVRAAGLDPSRATVKELDKCDAWLVCTECGTTKERYRGRASWAYAWDAALAHCFASEGHGKWEPLKGAELAKAREWARKKDPAAKEDPLLVGGWGTVYSCTLCPDWDGCWKSMKDHLAQEHGIVAANDDENKCVRDGTVYVSAGMSHDWNGRRIVLSRS